MLSQLQERILFHPKKLPDDFKYELRVPFEEINICSSTQPPVNAVLVPTQNSRKGVVLYIHGNADNLQRWIQYHSPFTDGGYDFLAYDYRTFGKTKGLRNESSFYEDAINVYDYLQERYPNDTITIVGRSLGTGIASWLATQKPCKQLILETPYSALKDVVKNWIPFLDGSIELKYNFSTVEHLPKIKVPITVFHGTKDRIIPYYNAQKLLNHLKSEDKFITVEGAGHRNYIESELYHSTIREILSKK